MANCIRCGGPLGEFDAGGDMICDSCESRGSGHGSGTDVPCQRCGMYLPSHELQMWNSRLYCAYCIMDVKDEERYGKEKHHSHQSGAGHSPIHGRTDGTCQRCGRDSQEFYSSQGLLLCPQCFFEDGGAEPGANRPSRFGQVITFIRKKLGLLPKPRIIPVDPRPVKVEKDPHVFDIRGRKMVDRKNAIEEKKPLSDGKKPSEAKQAGRGETGKERASFLKKTEGKKFFLDFKDKSD